MLALIVPGVGMGAGGFTASVPARVTGAASSLTAVTGVSAGRATVTGSTSGVADVDGEVLIP